MSPFKYSMHKKFNWKGPENELSIRWQPLEFIYQRRRDLTSKAAARLKNYNSLSVVYSVD